ncbi:MAG: NADH-quinone oxidoreductase subunit NuoK [Actinomycetota bacterium]
MHLVYPLALASLLFSIGMYGVLARRNAVLVLMSIEIMLNAVNINFVAFNAYWQDNLLQGQIFALFVITVAAAEVGVGLAIVLLIFRNRESIDIDALHELGDSAAPPRALTTTRPDAEPQLEHRG